MLECISFDIPTQLMLAVQHHQAGRLDEAEAIYLQILTHDSRNADALHLLGVIAKQRCDYAKAIDLINHAILLNGQVGVFHANLGNVYRAMQRPEDAEACYRKAVAIQPDCFDAWSNLGQILAGKNNPLNGQLEEAQMAFRQALKIRPECGLTWVNLGALLLMQGLLLESISCFKQAVSLRPDHARILNGLIHGLRLMDHYEEAMACYRLGLALPTCCFEVVKSMLNTMMYMPDCSRKDFEELHRYAEERYAKPRYDKILPHLVLLNKSLPDPDRKLRIGYCSSDFSNHPVGRNVVAILSHHDRKQFDVYCYAHCRTTDFMTERFQSLANVWRPILDLDDESVARQMRADQIDILVMLAHHFDSNRPLIAAFKPAPVQISFHNPMTSGLTVMDGLISDRNLTPRNRSDEYFSERLVRLPSFYLHDPLLEIPIADVPPCLARGSITFGSFNNPGKINKKVLTLWSELLRRLPTARILFKFYDYYRYDGLRKRVLDHFIDYGIESERILFEDEPLAYSDLLASYNRVDIALDPFPFCGATTTFETCWMGVPLVTLPGSTMVSRWSAAMLKTLKLDELIAQSEEDYLRIAIKLSQSPDWLRHLRGSLRTRVRTSPLCNAGLKTRQLERVYRYFWRKWLAESV